MSCPGCDGPKSKRAALCKTCRKKANAVGASVLTHVHEQAVPAEAPARPRTVEQNRVYHGRLSDLAPAAAKTAEKYQQLRALKRAALSHASRTFGRTIESSTELSELEMEQLLEWLDDGGLDVDTVLAAAAGG